MPVIRGSYPPHRAGSSIANAATKSRSAHAADGGFLIGAAPAATIRESVVLGK